MTPGFDVPLDLRAYAPGEWLVLHALTYHADDFAEVSDGAA